MSKNTKESLVSKALTEDKVTLVNGVQSKVLKATGVSPSKMKILNEALNAEVLDKVAQDMIAKYT